MKTSTKGIELIKKFEGFSPTPYLCPANLVTIGYGHVITDSDKEKFQITKSPNYQITKKQAEEILIHDLKVAESAVNSLIKVPLNQNQFDSLISFTFNLGSGALQSSTLRQKINRMEYRAAASEFLRWVYAGGQKLQGLLLRRQAELQLYNA